MLRKSSITQEAMERLGLLPAGYGPPVDPLNIDHLSVYPRDIAALGRVFELLAEYCRLKSTAMECRLYSDNIQRAMKLEQECEQVYKQLPEWARW